MGHFCIWVSSRCSLTNLNSSRAGVARFRNIFDQILAPHSLSLVAKYRWNGFLSLGKAPWVHWEEHSNAEGFLYYSTIWQKPEQPVRQMLAVFEGWEGSGLEQSLGRTAFPAEPCCPWAEQTPRACLTPRICAIGQLSWVNHTGRDEGCLQQDLLLWKPLAL